MSSKKVQPLVCCNLICINQFWYFWAEVKESKDAWFSQLCNLYLVLQYYLVKQENLKLHLGFYLNVLIFSTSFNHITAASFFKTLSCMHQTGTRKENFTGSSINRDSCRHQGLMHPRRHCRFRCYIDCVQLHPFASCNLLIFSFLFTSPLSYPLRIPLHCIQAGYHRRQLNLGYNLSVHFLLYFCVWWFVFLLL